MIGPRCPRISLLLAALLAPALAPARAPLDSARADSAARKLKAVVVSESRSAGSTGGASFAAEKTVMLSRRAGKAIRALRTLLSIDNAPNTVISDQCGLPQPGRTLRVMFTFR